MPGMKRTSQDDQYTPQGLQNGSKRSKTSLVESRSSYTPTPIKQRPLHQRPGSLFDYLPGVVKSFFCRTPEASTYTPSRKSALGLSSAMASPSTNRSSRPRGDSKEGSGGGRFENGIRRFSGSNNNNYASSPLSRPNPDNKVIDITREADEQSEFEYVGEDDDPISMPGPSRHHREREKSRHTRSPSRSSDIEYLGTAPRKVSISRTRTNQDGEPLAGQTRRRERNRRWEAGVYDITELSDEEGKGRARRQTPKDHTIPLMEEQLALWKHKEFVAQEGGDMGAQREACRTVLSFERAIKAARAEQEAKKQQSKPAYSTLGENGSLISYQARLAALRPQANRAGALLRALRVEPQIHRPRPPIPPEIKSPVEINDLFNRLDLERKTREEEYLKTQKPTIPDKLSAEESAIVRQTLSNRAFKTTVVGNENIEPKNIGRFQQGWLADDNITYYLALVAARNASSPTYPKIHCFNTFFYAKISTAGHSAVRRWTKKVDIFAKDMCLVPINLGNMHWIAAVINFKQKRIEYFDSMGDYGDGMQDVFYHLEQYVMDEHQDKKKEPYDMSDWKHVHAPKAPRQNNGSDCGVFSCQTLELVARGSDPIDKGFEFSAVNMPYFRQLMLLEITQGRLKHRW